MQSVPRQREQQGRLPNLIIIGAMKCGTTSLHYYLNQHPQVFMSREKELNFFLSGGNWHQGIDWYKSHFIGTAKIYGEASPNYTSYPDSSEVPKRMFSIVPEVKLIYIVRDPIKRLISHYVHQYADGSESRSIHEVLNDFNNQYVGRSKYYLQIEQYLEYFPATNILIITSEELSLNSENTLKKVFGFLDIDINLSSYDFHRKLHKSIYKRRKNSLGNWISDTSLMKSLEKLPPEIRYNFQKIIYFLFSEQVKTPLLDRYSQERLVEYLRKDIDKLRKFSKYNFENWSV